MVTALTWWKDNYGHHPCLQIDKTLLREARQALQDGKARRGHGKGIKLIMDLVAQYRGNNNGDLCLAWKTMKPRGWKSEDTLNNAKDELIEKQWINGEKADSGHHHLARFQIN